MVRFDDSNEDCLAMTPSICQLTNPAWCEKRQTPDTILKRNSKSPVLGFLMPLAKPPALRGTSTGSSIIG